MSEGPNVVYDPQGLGESYLPTVFAFLNGGFENFYQAVAISEDGYCLGQHICSSESFVARDLGVLPETRPDRHVTYREHYPHGYRTEFVRSSEVDDHERLQAAIHAAEKLAEEGKDDE